MNRLIVGLLITIVIFGCREKTLNIGTHNVFDIEKNISYGENAEQKMYLYLPQNNDTIKGIFVIIHGGGWKSGDKSQLMTFVISLMKKFPDYAFANINYRLASNSRFALPNQTNDIDSALNLLTKQGLKTIDKKPFILLGNSAGAHLSMLYGYNSFFDFKHHNKIKAVVNIVGPADLLHKDFANYSDYAFIEKHMIDLKTPTPTDLTNRDISNPIYWINEKSPPTISFYGNNDQIIPLSQKSILDSALNKNKVYNKSYEFSEGHLDWMNEKNIPFLNKKIDEFLSQIK